MTAQAAAEYRHVRRKSPPALAEIAAVVSAAVFDYRARALVGFYGSKIHPAEGQPVHVPYIHERRAAPGRVIVF